jgi:predicted TIM-barrel fold metal-dependent hydrolase
MMMLAACGPTREPAVDAALDAEIQKIRAIDHHAHPARVTAKGEPPDRGFDALPVDNMEPMSDPLIFRPSNPAWGAANRALFGSQNKQQTIDAKGEQYPAWVLDQIGVDIMFANRVELGSSVQPPRFRWVAFADALMFPLDTTKLGERNSDRKSFFVLEDALRKKYLDAAGLTAPPATLAEYLSRVVTPTLERHKQGGALAEKFEAAYLRTLSFDRVDRATADRIYGSRNVLAEAEYKPLQDFLFRYIAAECGRLGMAVHIHTGEGAGSYYDVQGANPLQLESVLSDPELRKTNFVMVHGGWPFVHQAAALLIKPNAYLDFSMQPMLLSPATVAGHLREWLEFVPEKVMFGTDAYPFSPEMGWEEAGWVASRNARQALALALTAMLRDGSITRERAVELARMVLRDNARKLYAL